MVIRIKKHVLFACLAGFSAIMLTPLALASQPATHKAVTHKTTKKTVERKTVHKATLHKTTAHKTVTAKTVSHKTENKTTKDKITTPHTGTSLTKSVAKKSVITAKSSPASKKVTSKNTAHPIKLAKQSHHKKPAPRKKSTQQLKARQLAKQRHLRAIHSLNIPLTEELADMKLTCHPSSRHEGDCAEWQLNNSKHLTGVSHNKTNTRVHAVKKIAISKLLHQIGKPYHWGGTSPTTGFDCSGLVYFAYKGLLNFPIPRTASDMYHLRDAAPVARDQLKIGDLVFFHTDSRTYADHVGVYVGDSKFIQSPRKGEDVQITSMEDSYWQNHYIGARRLVRPDTVR